MNKMSEVDAVNVLTQAVNIGISKGNFNNTKDVVTLHLALETLANAFGPVDTDEGQPDVKSLKTKK